MGTSSSSSRRPSFVLGAVTNWLAFAATLGVSFFLTPYLISTLGKPRYDVWCVAESVLAYFTLLDLGVAACLVRYVARHHAQADRQGLNRIASCCLGVFLVAGTVALLIGLPVISALAQRLGTKVEDPADLRSFLMLMLVNLAFTLPLTVFPSILDGLERFTAKSVVRIVFLLLRTTAIVIALETQTLLFPLAVVYTVMNLAEHLTMALLCRRFLPGLRFSVRSLDRATFRQVFTYSVDAFLTMLAGRITVQTGVIIVGLFLPAGAVTFYATAARLVEYAKTLLRTITTTLTPGVSAMEARCDWPGIRRLFLTATRWMLYLVLPVNLGLWFFGKPFLAAWVGPEFVAESFPVVAVLALTLSLGVAQSVASRILYGLGRLRFFARLALVEAVLNVSLMVALIGPFELRGVAWAVAIPNILFCGIVILFTLKQLEATIADYLRCWLTPLLVGLIPASIWLMMGEVEAEWSSLGIGIAAGLLPYAFGVGLIEFRGKLTPVWRRVPSTPLPSPLG